MTFKLEKSNREGEGYFYLSKKDSDLYDKHKDSKDEKSKLICEMLLDKAQACRGQHCASRY